MKILIIRPGALGDTLMLAPSISVLGASSEIVLVGRTPGIEILRPFVRLCIDYEGPGWHTLYLDDPVPGIRLPVQESDLAVAFLSDPEGTVKKNLAFALPGAEIHLFPPFPSAQQPMHTALYLARCLRHAGASLDPARTQEMALQKALLYGEESVERTGDILLHPGSGSQSKNHPPVFWMDLMEEIRPLIGERRGVRVLLGQAEESLVPFFRKGVCGPHTGILFSPAMHQVISLLKKAPLYVGHDSGITHLAALLGTPTIALFTSSSPVLWRPLGPLVNVIESQESGQGLLRKVFRAAGSMLCDRVDRG